MTNNILTEFFNYLKNPRGYLLDLEKKPEKINLKVVIWKIIQILAVLISFAFILVSVSNYISNLVGFDQTANNTVTDFLSNYPLWFAFLMVVIIGPFTEEAGFRLFLTKNKEMFFVGLAFFGYFVIQFLFDLFLNLDHPSLQISMSFFGILFAYFLILIFLNFRVTKDQIATWVQKYFIAFTWFSIISFGLLHITNYLSFREYFYLIPLLISPQLFAGLFLAFTRTKFGFGWAFGLHAIYNFVLSLSIFVDPNSRVAISLINAMYFGLLLICIWVIINFIFTKLRIEIVE